MTSNRPAKEHQLVLFCTEENCASNAPELQLEQSASAVVEKSALSMQSENLMEKIVDQCADNSWKELTNRVLPGGSRFPNRMAPSDISAYPT